MERNAKDLGKWVTAECCRAAMLRDTGSRPLYIHTAERGGRGRKERSRGGGKDMARQQVAGALALAPRDMDRYGAAARRE